MKLVNPNFLFNIEFEENRITNIIIESPKIFEEMLNGIYIQILGDEGDWILSENSTPIDIKKYSEIIINPFDLDINNKRILGKLYDNIKSNTLKTDLCIKWNSLYSNVSEVIEALIEDYDYSLEYDDELEIKDVLKLVNLKFTKDSVGSLEKLIDYMNLHNSILGTKLFILVNIKSFYTHEKIKYLYEQAFYKKYTLLVIENKEAGYCDNNEKCFIIDKDGCLIS